MLYHDNDYKDVLVLFFMGSLRTDIENELLALKRMARSTGSLEDKGLTIERIASIASIDREKALEIARLHPSGEKFFINLARHFFQKGVEYRERFSEFEKNVRTYGASSPLTDAHKSRVNATILKGLKKVQRRLTQKFKGLLGEEQIKERTLYDRILKGYEKSLQKKFKGRLFFPDYQTPNYPKKKHP